jgi:tetratricopeptide (TPR) repeat protein
MSPSGVVCAKCGASMPAGGQFCGRCGTPMAKDAGAPSRGEPPRRPVAPVRKLLVAWGLGILAGLLLGRALPPGATAPHGPAAGPSQAETEDIGSLLARARAAEDAKRFSEARDLYRKVLARAPEDRSARVDLGIAELALGDEAAARESFEAALAGDAPHPAAAYNLGRMAEDAGRLKEARARYRLYLKLAPDGPQAESVKAKLAPGGPLGIPPKEAASKPGKRP